jgi:hypothetical protein
MNGYYKYFDVDQYTNTFKTDGGLDVTIAESAGDDKTRAFNAVIRALNHAFAGQVAHFGDGWIEYVWSLE